MDKKEKEERYTLMVNEFSSIKANVREEIQ